MCKPSVRTGTIYLHLGGLRIDAPATPLGASIVLVITVAVIVAAVVISVLASSVVHTLPSLVTRFSV